MLRTLPALAFASCLLVSCGSGGGNADTAAGEISLTLTDAASDELDLFEVDVTGIVFHRVNGASVSVLAKRTRVDFASLEDLADLIVGRGLTAGVYTGLTMTLDFSNAVVYLKNGASAATVVDTDGNPITGSVDVAVSFASAHRPRIVVNRHHLYVLDLDLDQAITPDTAGNRVTFVPVVTATVDPTNPKTIGASGRLVSVDTANRQFSLSRLASDDSLIGTITVAVSDTTVYQVDGVVYTGSTGLTALAALSAGTYVFAQGALTRGTRVLQAAAVEAGAGVFGNGQDWVEGFITGRNNSAAQDCSLTVLGHSKDVSSGIRTFNTAHTVQVRYGVTRVLRRGAGNALTTDHLNVGQRVLVFGTLSGTTLDATATTGVARQLRTSVFGTATGSVSASTLTLNVSRFGLRAVAGFNFTVGGIVEAVPTAYTVDVTGLATGGITTGARIRAIGWVNEVGNVADRNFTALSLVNRTGTKQLEICLWVPPVSTAITSATASAIALDVSAALLKKVEDGFASTTLTTAPTPTIVPKGATGNYRIVRQGGVEVHYGFDTFAAALNTLIAPTTPVRAVLAFGDFAPTTQVLSAESVTVHLR